MKPLDFSLLTDENIAPDVVEGLRVRGCDLRTAREERLIGRPDVGVLERATSQGRVVVTHDLGFGRSAIIAGATFLGIVYLRPGHISAAFVLGVIDALRTSTVWRLNHRSSLSRNGRRPPSAFARAQRRRGSTA